MSHIYANLKVGSLPTPSCIFSNKKVPLKKDISQFLGAYADEKYYCNRSHWFNDFLRLVLSAGAPLEECSLQVNIQKAPNPPLAVL